MSDVTENQNGNSHQVSSLLNLPLTVLENIITYLNYPHILYFSYTCKYVQSLCADKVRNDFKKLRKKILVEIKKKKENNNKNLSLKVKETNLKYKYLLQILYTEISLVLVIFRQNLRNHCICFSLGHLIDDFDLILNKVQNRSIKSWGDIKCHKKLIQNKVSKYINNLNNYKICQSSIGVQMSDLLDITINSKYEIYITYNLLLRTCEIKAKYEIENIKILNFLPDLSIIDCNHHKLTNDENSLIINFFAFMIKVNNYFTIQDQHYQERMELYQRKVEEESSSSDKNKYNSTERIYISNQEIKELYKNVDKELNYSGKGLWIEMDLNCSINEAPIKILENWEKIINEFDKKNNNSTSSNESLIPFSKYNICIKFKKYLSESINCITIIKT